jgi:hypothetical protein
MRFVGARVVAEVKRCSGRRGFEVLEYGMDGGGVPVNKSCLT